MKGWWVGHPDIGGVLVRAESRNKARAIGADEMGVDYVGVEALRVSALDNTGPEGVIDWDEGKRLGAVLVCSRCEQEWARTIRRRDSTICGECGAALQELGEEAAL